MNGAGRNRETGERSVCLNVPGFYLKKITQFRLTRFPDPFSPRPVFPPLENSLSPFAPIFILSLLAHSLRQA
jgi:hypothetical protein